MSAVENVEYAIIQPLQSKSSSFTSFYLPVNQCESVTIQLTTSSSSSLSAKVEIEGSIDGDSWSPLKGTFTDIVSDVTLIFSLSDIKSLGYVRATVTISAGSAIFYIIGRAV